MSTVSAKYLGDLRVECVHNQSGTKIITDAPSDNQGKGESFSPTDLCATALGTCAMTIVGIYAKNHGLDVTGTEVEITKVMSADPRGIGKIEVILPVALPFHASTGILCFFPNAWLRTWQYLHGELFHPCRYRLCLP